ncbi:hypothetical protein GQ457_15G024610 [Hibiscus cannabinus]
MSWCEGEVNDVGLDDGGEVHVGVVVDMGTWQGKVIQNSISMAISDFFVQKSCRVRVILHFRDSQGDPFQALSAALNLWEDAKVEAILGAQTLTEAEFLTEFGDRNKIPVISFSQPTSFSFSTRSPFFVQIGDDQTSQIKAIAAFIELHKWRNVILIHQEYDFSMEDGDDGNMLSAMSAFLQEKNIHISFVAAIAASSEDDQIIEQLDELNTFQTEIFIVHLPHSLASRLFMNAKRLGMMGKGYAWIVTSKTMDQFGSRDSLSSAIDRSMQGVIGFRSYIPTSSRELQNFTSRLRRKLNVEDQPWIVDLRLGLLAYDAAWSLAKAVERLTVTPQFSNELHAYRTTLSGGSMLLREILRSNFKGLGGEFRFINGKFISKAFEVVNVVDNGAKRVGFCTSTGEITTRTYEHNRRRRRLSDDIIDNIEPIIWPGGSLTVPQGRQDRMLQTDGGKILRIGVPVKVGFRQLVEVKRDPFTNSTSVTGFCIEVFKAALEGLKYQVQYEFIPFMVADGNSAGTYADLIHQVYLKKFDAAVGDITITSARSLIVDFTMSFTDIGVGIVAPAENKDMWIFYKVLSPTLWLAIIGYYALRSFFIWMIERQSPRHDPEPIRLSPIVVGSWEQLRNKWSIFIAAISLFVLFILSSSYTATLASMMTVQHIELHSKRSYIGYLGGSNITQGVLIDNMNFENDTMKPFFTPDEYADALSKGSRKGGVSAILDEMPYIKIFLAEHPRDFSLIKSMPITNGFAFVFPKGSPLVPDLSREIAKLRESGKLELLENVWFRSQISLTPTPSEENDATDNVERLTPESFGGLFLTTTGLSVGAFFMFQLPLLYHSYFHVVKKWAMDFVRRRIGSSMKFFQRRKMVQSAAIHPQVQIT